MKTVKQIDEELNSLLNDKEKINIRQTELEEQKRKALERFENKIKKMFGVVDVDVRHSNMGVGIRTKDSQQTDLFDYNFERMTYESIGIENAEKIKKLYEEIYGYPRKHDIYRKISNARTTLLNNWGGRNR
jgi:hypothetical protein